MNLKLWLKAILVHFITGGATALSTAGFANWLAPDKFNLDGGAVLLFKLAGLTFIFGGLMSVGAYLAKSPLPEKWNGTNRRENPPA